MTLQAHDSHGADFDVMALRADVESGRRSKEEAIDIMSKVVDFNKNRNETGWITGKELLFADLDEERIRKCYAAVDNTSNQRDQDKHLLHLFNNTMMSKQLNDMQYRRQIIHEVPMSVLEAEEEAKSKGKELKHKELLYDNRLSDEAKDAHLEAMKDKKAADKARCSKVQGILKQDMAYDDIPRREFQIAVHQLIEVIKYRKEHLAVFCFFLIQTDCVRRLDAELRSLLTPLIQRIYARMDHGPDTKFKQIDFIESFENFHPNLFYKVKAELAQLMRTYFR